MTKLTKLTKRDISTITDKDTADLIVQEKKEGGPMLKVGGRLGVMEENPVLELEIALRQCERTGFFGK